MTAVATTLSRMRELKGNILSWLSKLRRKDRHEAPIVQHASFRFDLATAKQVAQDLELNNPELVVAGIRPAVSMGASRAWIIDVVNRHTGQMTSLSERDNWPRRLQEILPCRSAGDARLAQRPVHT